MTISIKKGDLLKEQAEAIVNTVNCVGIMGKGIALQFKQKWPSNFKQYEQACKAKEMHPGKMLVHELGQLAGKPYYIINFPTKDHWRGKSQLSFIEDGLKDLVQVIKHYHITSIAIPPLGCGNGGLDWQEVYPLIRSYLEPLEKVDILVFEPSGAPDAKSMVIQTKKPPMSIGRAILIKLLSIYREMDYSLSKIEVQKLCYFVYIAGEMHKLKFGKNQFGPYADNLRHVLNDMSGHYITGVGDHDTSEAQITLMDGAITEADEFLKGYPESINHLVRVSTLIEGFQTPYGMELLATVHWVATYDTKDRDLDTIVNAIYNWEPTQPSWNARKKALMQKEHIAIALERLEDTGWLN